MNASRRHLVKHSLAAGGLVAIGLNAFAQNKSAQSARAMRLVSIGGALTEIIYALRADADLVGVDTTSIYPSAATQLPSLGYARRLSSEGILALRPTQLISTEDAGPPIVLKQIADAGIPMTILPSHYRFEGVIERVQKIGELIGKRDDAKALTHQLKMQWHQTQDQVASSRIKNLRVLFILSQNPSQVMVSGDKTSADAVIVYAGARNAISGFSGFKPLTPEAVIAANPDVILMTDQGMKAVGGIGGVLRFPGIDQTRAGKQRKIVSLEAMYLLGFGPRLPMAVADLNALLQQAVA